MLPHPPGAPPPPYGVGVAPRAPMSPPPASLVARMLSPPRGLNLQPLLPVQPSHAPPPPPPPKAAPPPLPRQRVLALDSASSPVSTPPEPRGDTVTGVVGDVQNKAQEEGGGSTVQAHALLLQRVAAAEAGEASAKELVVELGGQLGAAYERLEALASTLEALEDGKGKEAAGAALARESQELERLRGALEAAERCTAVARAEAASERSLRLHCEAELERRERELRGERAALEQARTACGVAHEAGRRAGLEEGRERGAQDAKLGMEAAVGALEGKWGEEVGALKAQFEAELAREVAATQAAQASLQTLAHTYAQEVGLLRAEHEASLGTWREQVREAKEAAAAAALAAEAAAAAGDGGEAQRREAAQLLAAAEASHLEREAGLKATLAGLEEALKESKSHAKAQAALREQEAGAWGEAAEAFERACESALQEASAARGVGVCLASCLAGCVRGYSELEGILGVGGVGGGGALLAKLTPFLGEAAAAAAGGAAMESEPPSSPPPLPPLDSLAKAVASEGTEGRWRQCVEACRDLSKALTAVSGSLAQQRRGCAEDAAKVMRLEALVRDSQRGPRGGNLIF